MCALGELQAGEETELWTCVPQIQHWQLCRICALKQSSLEVTSWKLLRAVRTCAMLVLRQKEVCVG